MTYLKMKGMSNFVVMAFVALLFVSCDDQQVVTNSYVRQFEGKTIKRAEYNSPPGDLIIRFADSSVMVIKSNGYLYTDSVPIVKTIVAPKKEHVHSEDIFINAGDGVIIPVCQ